MADPSGPNLTTPVNLIEKQDKHEGADCLMERLRQSSQSSLASWTDTTKLLNLSLSEKKQIGSDSMKPQLGKHLDALQKAFKVHGFRGVSERLERVSASLGLRATSGPEAHLSRTCVLEAECFHVDVVLDAGGTAKDVRIKHESDRDGAVRCAELQKLINEGKWEEMKEHLSGILAIYSIGHDKKQRSRTFSTLQALESDLLTLSKFQGAINNVPNLIMKSPLGIVVPRVAGRAMKLVYFVSPYDLLDENTRALANMTAEGIAERGLGHSVTVTIEASAAQHKLQNITLLTPKPLHDGKSVPSFMPLNKNNSCILPAVFTLRLHEPLPVAYSLIKAIQSTTGVELSGSQELEYRPLSELIVRSVLTESEDPNLGLSVVLPGQKHNYSLHCCADCDDQLGALVTAVPFLHPTHVARVIQLLRQQALYNSVLSSCVRQHATSSESALLAFEVTAVSMQAISVCFEHPFTDQVTTAMFDLSDVTAVRCHVTTSDGQSSVTASPDLAATNVFQRCLSLPITLRHIARSLSSDIESRIAPPSPSPPQAAPRFLTRKIPLHQLSKIGQERRTAFIESRQAQDSTAGSVEGYHPSRGGPYPNTAINSHHGGSFSSVSSSSSQFTPPPPVAAASVANAVPAAPAAVAAMSASAVHSNTPPPPLTNQQAPPHAPPGIPTPISVHKASLNLPLSSTHVPNASAVAPLSLAQATPRPRTNNPAGGGLAPRVPPTTQGQATIVSPEIGDDMQFVDPSKVSGTTLEAIKKDKIKKNPMLASLLDQERESPEPVPSSQHSMLSQLLGDAPDPAGLNMPHKTPQMAAKAQQPSGKRKRKSLGDSQGSVGMGGLQPQLGMSPKRLASEHDVMGKGYPPHSSADHNDSSHIAYHDPHHGHYAPNHPHHHHHHHHNNMDAGGGVYNSQHHGGLPLQHPMAGPPSQHSNVSATAAANFHTQTRVDGASAPLYSVSSSQPSQSTHNNKSVPSPVLPSPTGPPQLPPHMSPRSRMSGSTSGGFMESHVSLLANSVDNFIKQESDPLSNHSVLSSSSSSTSVVSTTLVSSTSSALTSPKTVSTSYHTITSSVNTSSTTSAPNAHLAQLLNFSVQDSKMQPPHPQNVQLTSAAMPHAPTKNNATFNAPHVSELVSLLSDDSGGSSSKSGLAIKQELILDNIKEEKPSLSHSFSTVDDSIFKTESDPFEFTESFLGQPTNVDGAFDSTHHSSMDISEQKPVCTPSSTPKHSSSFPLDKKPHHETTEQSKNMFDHPKKERKKASSRSGEQASHSKDKLPSVNLKININTKTNTIVRQSPHRIASPATVNERSMDGLHGNSTPDAFHDSSRDSDVFITHASSHGSKSEHNNVDYHGSSHKSLSKKSDSVERKKKKKLRNESDGKHERKRKREEARLKEEQQKKAKNVYDFDFNESEHLPPIKPTKIKIRTLDGQMSIQTTHTGTKKLTMSPLPMKASLSRSDSVSESGRSSKSHKSEHKKHKPSSKHKSKSSSSHSGKVDKSSDSKLSKTPVVKIKPLHSSNPSNGSNQGNKAVSTPQSAPVRLNSSPADCPSLNKTLKVAISNLENVKNSGARTPHTNHYTLSDNARSKSLSNLSHDSNSRSVKETPQDGTSGTPKVLGASQSTDSKSQIVLVNSVSDNKTNVTVTSSSSSSKPNKSHITSPNCVSDKSRPSLTSVNASSKQRSSDSSDKSKKQSSVNGASADENKTRVVGSSGSDQNKARTSQSSADAKSKSASHSVTTDSKARTSVSNSAVDSKTRTPTSNSSSSDANKSRTSVHNSDSSRAKTPTQLALPDNKMRSASTSVAPSGAAPHANDTSSKNRALSSSAVPPAHTNNSDAVSKPKSSSASEKDNRDNRSKHEKNLSAQSSSDSQRNKAAPATKQRKSSLSQVIDKLTKGLDSDSVTSQNKKAQDVYDKIRREILGHGGAKKQSTPTLKFKKKDGKLLTKQDTSSGTPPVSSVHNKTPANTQNAMSKQSNQSKHSSSPNVLNKHKDSSNKHLTSFRIPKAENKGQKGDQRTSSDNKTSLSKGDSRTVNDSKVVVNKNDPRTSGDSKVTSAKADHRKANPANEAKSNATSSVNSTDTKDKRQSLPNASARPSQSGGATGPGQFQKHNSRDGDDKHNKASRNFKIDDISERLQTRHFLDAVVKIPPEGAGDGTKKHHPSPKYNSHNPHSNRERSKSPQVKSSNKPAASKSSTDPAANKGKSVTAPLNKVPSSSSHKYPQSNRPKTPITDLKNSQLSSANKSSPPQELRKPEGDLRRPEVESKSTPETSTTDVPTTPDSPPANVSFYNPAAALGRKPGSGDARKNSVNASWNKNSPVTVPLNKTSGTTIPKSSAPVVTIPLDKPAPSVRKLPANKTSSPVIVPLNKTSPSDSKTKETPVSPIRHDTPPASPGGESSSDNKEKLAKAIPLGGEKRLSPPIEEITPASPDAEASAEDAMLKTEPVIIASEKVVASEKLSNPPASTTPTPIPITSPAAAMATDKTSKPPQSPRSDISSPEGLVIDDPEDSTTPLGPPRTIPLERSLCRSPVKAVKAPAVPQGGKSPGLIIKENHNPVDDSLMDAALGL